MLAARQVALFRPRQRNNAKSKQKFNPRYKALSAASSRFDNNLLHPPIAAILQPLQFKFTMPPPSTEKDKSKSKVHKLALKGSARLVAEFVSLARG